MHQASDILLASLLSPTDELTLNASYISSSAKTAVRVPGSMMAGTGYQVPGTRYAGTANTVFVCLGCVVRYTW